MNVFSIHEAIAKAALLLNDGDNRCLYNFGLNYTQYAVLQLLSPQQGKRLVDLATALLCERSTITRVVDRLEEAGLVQRQIDTEDRRSQRVVLTRKGDSLREEVRLIYEKSLQQRLNVLDGEEQLQLVALLRKLQESLGTGLAITTDISHE